MVMFEKPGKAKKNNSLKDKKHLGYIATLQCCVCGSWPTQVHHIRINGEPRDDYKTIPLCFDHHLGENGLHTLGKYEFRKRFGHELEMLSKINLDNK